MVNNTTCVLSTGAALDDDTVGAIIFIIGVIVWYSLSAVFLMAMQIGTSNPISDHSTKHRKKVFTQNDRDQSHNKEILKELADKKKRDKLWDIYLGTSGDMNAKNTRAEILRIRRIEKQLASINKSRRERERSISDNHLIASANLRRQSSVSYSSAGNPPLRPRRRSSLDQQIIQEWKVLGDELKTYENWPWAIQKVLIRRQLRQQRHVTEP